MKAIIYQANARERDPVYGCLGVLVRLQREIEYTQRELNLVKCQILFYKQQSDFQMRKELHQRQQMTSFDGERCYQATECGDVIELNSNGHMTQEYLNSSSFQQCMVPCEIDFKDFNSQSFYQATPDQDYDDIKPFDQFFFDAKDDVNDYKDAYESSAESSFKEVQSADHVPEEELKSLQPSILAK
ncbi:LOB domain-containing protein 13 [Nymphaea thermarum]|nr:LOB domain-containing protein 13 [Nymphaea thermarum]